MKAVSRKRQNSSPYTVTIPKWLMALLIGVVIVAVIVWFFDSLILR